jgi:hypothetical protein
MHFGGLLGKGLAKLKPALSLILILRARLMLPCVGLSFLALVRHAEAVATGKNTTSGIEQPDGRSTCHWNAPHTETTVASRQGCRASARPVFFIHHFAMLL